MKEGTKECLDHIDKTIEYYQQHGKVAFAGVLKRLRARILTGVNGGRLKEQQAQRLSSSTDGPRTGA